MRRIVYLKLGQPGALRLKTRPTFAPSHFRDPAAQDRSGRFHDNEIDGVLFRDGVSKVRPSLQRVPAARDRADGNTGAPDRFSW